MNVSICTTPAEANSAAAGLLARWLVDPGVRNVMLAAGNTPLELYSLIGARKLRLEHLNLFALDEYVGVPADELRNCANLIRRTAVEPWGVPPERYFIISSIEEKAEESAKAQEHRINEKGGLDVIVLGLGQNGHLGFNEPGSAEDSIARVLDLDPISTEANRKWFNGEYAPSRGATVGMKTILAARRVLIMAYGAHKAKAVKAMLNGPRTPACPASLLQGHAETCVILDATSATL
jgi:glucosamine-6-phosphate deaminase